MNELQLYLLAIGVAVIVAVLGFNRWQEYRYRRQAEQRFLSGHDDVLLAEDAVPERLEPVFNEPLRSDDEHVPDEPVLVVDESHLSEPDAVMASADEIVEQPVAIAMADMAAEEPAAQAQSVIDAFPSQPQIVAPVVVPHDAALAPDPQTEYVITLNAGDPITAHALVLVLQQLRNMTKPVRWLGQRNHHDSSHLPVWEEIGQAAPSAEFVRLAACLALADRNGPLSLDEINAFCDTAQAVAANLYAVMDCPDKLSALASAAELDQFCADVDVLIGVNVISRDGSPFAGTKLRGLAESAGMRLMPDGSFHYINDQGATLFTLANLEPSPFAAETMKHLSTHGVTFVFDVPKATGGVQAFNQMLLAARQFTGPLSALMVDDNRKELSDSGIDRIRQQLAAIYAMMEQHQIVPGSAQAMRLFA